MPSKDEVREALRAVIDPSCGARSSSSTWCARSRSTITGRGGRDRGRSPPPAARSATTSRTASPSGAHAGGRDRSQVDFDVLSDQQKSSLSAEAGRGRSRGPRRGEQHHPASPRARAAWASPRSPRTSPRRSPPRASGWACSTPTCGLLHPAHARLGAQRPKVSAERKILPLDAHSTSVMSIGFFVEEDSPVVWRGPMLHRR